MNRFAKACRSARAILLAATAAASLATWAATTHSLPEVKDLDVDPRSHATLETIKRLDDPRGVPVLKLAPDGAHVAMFGWSGRVLQLMVMDTATSKVTVIQAYPNLGDKDNYKFWPLAVQWIDSAHMVVDWNDGNSVVTGLQGERGRRIGTRLMRMMRKADGRLDDWAIVSQTGLFDHFYLHRVNVRTGEETNVPVGLQGDVVNLSFDRRGRLRAALTLESKWLEPGAKLSYWYRHDESSPWQLLQKIPTSAYAESWSVVGVADEGDELYVSSREGRDTWALFRYDPLARKLGELVIGDPKADVTGLIDPAQNTPVRVVTQGLKRQIHWFDPRWERLQRAIDGARPATTNELSGDPEHFVLVMSHSDRDPGQWSMLDVPRMKLRALGKVRLAVDPAQMRPMEPIEYDAPDGLKIPAYLTLPAGPDVPRPLVVYIHGGPEARDYWQFDFDVQLFAASGYAVFQPQFRGSTGFGKAFEDAGRQQWGRAMQDDVTAGVKALIASHLVDPARICVVGGSYGGYAAMWGLAKTPELYKCGVTLSGVSDIAERFTDWSDTNDTDEGRAELRLLVGDIKTMKPQFDEVSPTLHADRIHAPVLIGHGTADKRVPIGHAQRLESALQAAHQSVDAHYYYGEGHGLHFLQNHEHFAMLTVQFLDRNIGPASPLADKWVPVPAAAAPAASDAASAP